MTARRSRFHCGFTLIEAALATMIIGIGLVATLQLLAVGTNANIDGTKLMTGVNLARGVREMTLKSTYSQVRAMHDQTYSPPIDSRGTAIDECETWSQRIQVEPIDRDRLTTGILDPMPNVVRVTVTVSQNGNEICDLSWYRFKPMP